MKITFKVTSQMKANAVAIDKMAVPALLLLLSIIISVRLCLLYTPVICTHYIHQVTQLGLTPVVIYIHNVSCNSVAGADHFRFGKYESARSRAVLYHVVRRFFDSSNITHRSC